MPSFAEMGFYKYIPYWKKLYTRLYLLCVFSEIILTKITKRAMFYAEVKMKMTNSIKRWYKALRNRWISYATVIVTGLGAVACNSETPAKFEGKKVNTVENNAKVKNPVKQIRYVTDTLSARNGRALLFYRNGYITRNYVDKDNWYKMSLPLFSHEDWHAQVDKIKWRSRYKYTPFEYYKLCMHNEITANIAALLTTRYQYLAAENKKEFAKKNNKGVLGFYFKEVLAGNIKPGSKNPKELDKEYSFIANGMEDAWMKRFSKWYMPSIYGMMQRYVGNNGLIEDSKRNYSYVFKYMYTIGGVDFSKYLKEDIKPSDARVFLADGLSKVLSMRDGGVDIMDYINTGYPLLKNVGMDKQKEAFQHLLISSKLKYELRNRTGDELQTNPQIIDMYYRQILAKLQSDKTFEEYVGNFPSINENSYAVGYTNAKEYRKVISQLYTFNGVDLSSAVNNFKVGNIPVQTADFDNFNFINNQYYWSPVSEIRDEVWYTPYIKSDTEKNDNLSVQKKSPKRVSDWQFITIPDYRQPILSVMSDESNKAILQAIKDFDDIPLVLKECDTEAQKAYYASLKKTSPKKHLKSQQTARKKLPFAQKKKGAREN